jgi:hypothetical protein
MQRPWPMLKAMLVVRRGILTQTAFVQCTTLHACTTPASSRGTSPSVMGGSIILVPHAGAAATA